MLTLIISLAFLAIAVYFARYIIGTDRGHKEPVGALWTAFSFGLAGVFLASFLEAQFVSSNQLVDSTLHGSALLNTALLVGLIEESVKFLPLAWFIYKKSYFDEHTDGVYYFALAGLGLGLPENILYTLQYGADAGIHRLLLTPLFHSATTALVGYYLVRKKLDHRSWWTVVVAFAAAILIHAAYDYGLLSGNGGLAFVSVCITFGITGLLFRLLHLSVREDVAAGLSSDGNNGFCRHCGWPNPRHDLHCTHCGRRA